MKSAIRFSPKETAVTMDSASSSCPPAPSSHRPPPHRHVVLFYRYFLPGDDSNNLSKATLDFFRHKASHYLPLLQLHQLQLCQTLGNMKGRILISTEGINGTLSCPAEKELNQYIERMEKFDLIDELGGVPDGYRTRNQQQTQQRRQQR